jgi:hypothetical protein
MRFVGSAGRYGMGRAGARAGGEASAGQATWAGYMGGW